MGRNGKELITQSEFAKRMGVSAAQVSIAVKTGRIAYAKGTKLLDFENAKSDWEANRSDHLAGTGTANIPKTGKTAKGGKGSSLPKVRKIPEIKPIPPIDDGDDEEDGNEPRSGKFMVYKTRQMKAKAEREEMKAAQERGELIAKSDVLTVFFTFLVGIKNGIVAVPERVVGLINAATDQYKDEPEKLKARVYEVLREEHNRILDDLANLELGADKEIEKIAHKHQ